MCTEIYIKHHWRKEFKKISIRLKVILCSWFEGLNILKMALLPQVDLQIQCNMSKFQDFAKVVIEKLILKLIWNLKGSRVEIVMKKNKPRGLSLPDFKTYYRATVVKTMWYWNERQTQRPMKQLVYKPLHTSKDIFKIKCHDYSMEKGQSLTNGAVQMWNGYITYHTLKISSKWIIRLNVSAQTLANREKKT